MSLFMVEKAPEPAWLVLAGLNILVGLLTIVFNSVVLWFYRPRARQPLTHLLFFLLALSDIMTGVSSLLHSGVLVIYYQLNAGGDEAGPTSHPLTTSTTFITSTSYIVTRQVLSAEAVFCMFTYFVTQFSKQLSIFMNLILSFIRTLHVISPGCLLKRTVVITTVLVFALCTATLLSVVMYYTVWIVRDIAYGDELQLIFKRCYVHVFLPYIMTVDEISRRVGTEVDDEAVTVLFIVIPYILPSVICFICCAIFIRSLHSKPSLCGQVTRRNRHIIGTVLILTIIFIICCSTLILVWVYYDYISKEGVSASDTYPYVKYSVYNMLPMLNSALNPVVLIARGSNLRNFVLRGLQGSFSGSSNKTQIMKNTTISGGRRVADEDKERVELRSGDGDVRSGDGDVRSGDGEAGPSGVIMFGNRIADSLL